MLMGPKPPNLSNEEYSRTLVYRSLLQKHTLSVDKDYGTAFAQGLGHEPVKAAIQADA